MKTSRGHVAVVGAGVFGAASALELRRRKWDVTLLDPGPLPHEAASSTDVSKVIRMDYGSDVFHHELCETAMEEWDRWNRDWPRPLYHEDGFLILSAGPMEPGGFEYESWRVLRERGYEPRRVDPASLAVTCPAWRGEEYPDGYLNARGGWAESGAVVAHLLALGEAAGVRLHQATVASLMDRGSRVSGVVTAAGEQILAEHVVVSAGAWTPSLLPWLSDVIWSTGQPVLHFGVDDPEEFRGPRFPPWAADIANSGWYGFPALDDGRVKVGHHGPGVRIHPDHRGVVEDDHIERTRAFLRGAIPALADAPVVLQRVCMYCDTFDGDFLIDRDPHREGLVVATGGSGHGFKFAPLIGQIVADGLDRVPNRWASRFCWRARGNRRTEEARYGVG